MTIAPRIQFGRCCYKILNYGTGKSHLMILTSSIAENADLLQYAQNSRFRKASQVVAGVLSIAY